MIPYAVYDGPTPLSYHPTFQDALDAYTEVAWIRHTHVRGSEAELPCGLTAKEREEVELVRDAVALTSGA